LDSNINPIDDDTSSKMQRVIDRKIYASSLASEVANDNMSQKEAVEKMIKDRLADILSEQGKTAPQRAGETKKGKL
jgi:hypothetical protein